MAKEVVSDELWEIVEPLLPEEPPKPEGGRPRIDDRAALTGILFVLRTGIPWEMLPQEMGCGSGMTCWRRLREWHEAGVWERRHGAVLDCLAQADRIARRGVESGERLGRHRWVVERTLSWIDRFRRLKVRYERRADVHQAFLELGCALICWSYV